MQLTAHDGKVTLISFPITPQHHLTSCLYIRQCAYTVCVLAHHISDYIGAYTETRLLEVPIGEYKQRRTLDVV